MWILGLKELKGICHGVCYLLKSVQFCYLRLYLAIETVPGHLLQQMVRMDMI